MDIGFLSVFIFDCSLLEWPSGQQSILHVVHLMVFRYLFFKSPPWEDISHFIILDSLLSNPKFRV